MRFAKRIKKQVINFISGTHEAEAPFGILRISYRVHRRDREDYLQYHRVYLFGTLENDRLPNGVGWDSLINLLQSNHALRNIY